MTRFRLVCCLFVWMAGSHAMAGENEPATGYRGIWYTVGQDQGHGPKYAGGLGTYPANMVPMAVYDKATNTTWFVYGGTTPDSNTNLQIMIGAWHHDDGTVSRPTTIRDTGGFKDAHANPAMTLGHDGHLYVVAATRHKFEGRVYRSLRPRDHSAFEIVHRGYLAYPQIWYHKDTGYVLLHTRYEQGKRYLYCTRSANGIDWDEPACYARFNGHYQNSALTPDGTIVTAFNHHPKPHGLNSRTNLYVMQSTNGGRTWTNADGEPLETPLTSPDNDALALDARARGERVYIMDLAFDHRGRPIVLYLTSKHHATGPKGNPRTWRVLHQTEEGWREHAITTSTNNYDCGTLLVDGQAWTVIGPTANGPQPLQTGGEMVRWTSRDSGRTWSSEALTAGSKANHTYARRPVPHHDDFVAFWADGNPTRPGDSSLYVANRAGEVFRLPRQMSADRERPESAR